MKARFQDNGFFPHGQQLTLLNTSVMFNLARSMIFLWAPFFLRTDLEKQIGPVACQPQMWAAVPPGLARPGSVCPSLENSLSLRSQGVSQRARSPLTQRQGGLAEAPP